jgi:hypothetical protein
MSVHTHWLRARDLPALRRYKYSGTDASLVSKYVLQPYWTALARLVPRRVAPNTLTLLGLACTVSAYALAAWLGGVGYVRLGNTWGTRMI